MPRRYPRDGGALSGAVERMGMEPVSEFDRRLSEAISAIEAAIANLTRGDTGPALDDVLAARLLLTTLRAARRPMTPDG